MDTPRLTEKPNRSVTRIAFRDEDVVDAVQRVEYPIAIVQERTTHRRGVVVLSDPFEFPEEIETVCTLPELRPENLGDPGFLRAHGVRYPYIAGEMATGIATSDMVIAMARAAMLGFFGAGGQCAIQVGGIIPNP
jgi:hypothetical protein